jgi:hypothetical protein
MLVRLGLLISGLLVFFAGVREGSETLRWTGIALVATTVIIRLIVRIRRR